MGALVASFAHELNQPLTANLLHAELLQAQLGALMRGQGQPDPKTLHDVAEAMASDTQRAADIIRKLRNLFRMSKGEYTQLQMDQLVLEVLDLVQSKLKETNISLTTEFDKNLLVSGDLTQLQQVVLNLLNNAIDAMV
jgi:signal transduction histidine kinase